MEGRPRPCRWSGCGVKRTLGSHIGFLRFAGYYQSSGAVEAAQVAGLLYVWRNIVQVAFSYPAWLLADRYGHRSILIAGYALGELTAVLTGFAFTGAFGDVPALVAIFFLAGLYVAVQEALEPAVTTGMVSEATLATSYGAFGTVNGVTQFISSAAIGIPWSTVSPAFGFGIAALADVRFRAGGDGRAVIMLQSA